MSTNHVLLFFSTHLETRERECMWRGYFFDFGGRGGGPVDLRLIFPNLPTHYTDRKIFYLGIWTQLALAYAIHKSFIFIRIPLTAAVTPKVVKVLRGWGWDIGKRRPKRSG